jgi:hypothetical protein
MFDILLLSTPPVAVLSSHPECAADFGTSSIHYFIKRGEKWGNTRHDNGTQWSLMAATLDSVFLCSRITLSLPSFNKLLI